MYTRYDLVPAMPVYRACRQVPFPMADGAGGLRVVAVRGGVTLVRVGLLPVVRLLTGFLAVGFLAAGFLPAGFLPAGFLPAGVRTGVRVGVRKVEEVGIVAAADVGAAGRTAFGTVITGGVARRERFFRNARGISALIRAEGSLDLRLRGTTGLRC